MFCSYFRSEIAALSPVLFSQCISCGRTAGTWSLMHNYCHSISRCTQISRDKIVCIRSLVGQNCCQCLRWLSLFCNSWFFCASIVVLLKMKSNCIIQRTAEKLDTSFCRQIERMVGLRSEKVRTRSQWTENRKEDVSEMSFSKLDPGHRRST